MEFERLIRGFLFNDWFILFSDIILPKQAKLKLMYCYVIKNFLNF